MTSFTTQAWAKALPGSTGFSRYFVGADGVKWALLVEVEEDLLKFDLLRSAVVAGNQLYSFSADDRVWEPIQAETHSAAPPQEFLADVLEALKTRKPAFRPTACRPCDAFEIGHEVPVSNARRTKDSADGSVSLDILFKESSWFRLEATLPFVLKDAAVSPAIADLLLRQARVHDFAKTHPVVLTPPTVPFVVSPPSAVAPVVAAIPAPVSAAAVDQEAPRTANDALKAVVAEERRSRIEVPRGKNPKGISFGSKR